MGAIKNNIFVCTTNRTNIFRTGRNTRQIVTLDEPRYASNYLWSSSIVQPHYKLYSIVVPMRPCRVVFYCLNEVSKDQNIVIDELKKSFLRITGKHLSLRTGYVRFVEKDGTEYYDFILESCEQYVKNAYELDILAKHIHKDVPAIKVGGFCSMKLVLRETLFVRQCGENSIIDLNDTKGCEDVSVLNRRDDFSDDIDFWNEYANDCYSVEDKIMDPLENEVTYQKASDAFDKLYVSNSNYLL